MRRLVQIFVPLAAAALAVASPAASAAARSAGASQPAGSRPHPAVRPAAVSSAGWPTFHGSPDLQGVSADTTVSATNASTLGLAWMAPTQGAMLSSPMVAPDSTLGETLAYISNVNGYVEAFNIANGSMVWSDNLAAPIYGSPTVYNGSVWVGTFVNGHMYKLNATTGAIDCTISLGTGTDLASPTVATPPGGKPTVYFGVQDNGVVSGPATAVDETSCKVDWTSAPFSVVSGSWNPTSFGVDATGEPLVFIGTGDPDATAYALDAKTGAKVWSDQNRSPSYADVGAGITVSPPGRNGFADGMVYYPGKDRILYAIDMTTGQVAWTFNYGAATGSTTAGGRSAAALVGNRLVFGTPVGVMAVNAVTGKEIWDSQTSVGKDTEILSSPLITGPSGKQVVVYGDLKGKLIVLSLATGKELYSFKTHGYIVGSPADAAGNIIETSSDGFVYDFKLGGTNSASYPATAISSPVDGSTIPYPGSGTSQQATVTATGTASSAHSCNGVLVAVEENGAAGQWWNAASATWQAAPFWNQATLGSAGTCSAGWSFPVTVERQGAVLAFYARATDSDGEVDPAGTTSTVTVRPATTGPHLTLGSSMVSPGLAVSLTGGGFSPGEKVQISLPGAVLTTVTATSKGSLPSTRATVPSDFPTGVSGITGTGETSGLAATARLYVSTSWTELGHDPGRTGYQPNDVALSHVETPGESYAMAASVTFDTGAPISSSPAVSDLVAYVGNNAGDVEAISTTSGTAIWTATTGGAVKSSPAIDPQAGLVVVGSGDDNVYAFNMQTGATVWNTTTGGAVDSSPAILNGVVYVGSDDGTLYALNETTGVVIWSAAMSGQVTSSPAVDPSGDEVVAADSAGDVTAFSASGSSPGSVLWTHKTGGAAGTPIISGSTVYVGSADGNEYALSETTGAVTWSRALGGTPSVAALLKGDVYVGSSAGQLFALSAASGSVKWQEHARGPVTGLGMIGGMMFVESSNGDVASYRAGGSPVWVKRTGAGLSGTPAIVDNALIVGAGDSALYVYTPFAEPMT
jgi:outer membrane protein assembly factor BamB